MKTPANHRGWMMLINSLYDDDDHNWSNGMIDEIYPDVEKFSTIHRTKCNICNGNIIKFDEVLHHRYEFADISEQIYEFHNRNCARKQKLLKLNENR